MNSGGTRVVQVFSRSINMTSYDTISGKVVVDEQIDGISNGVKRVTGTGLARGWLCQNCPSDDRKFF